MGELFRRIHQAFLVFLCGRYANKRRIHGLCAEYTKLPNTRWCIRRFCFYANLVYSAPNTRRFRRIHGDSAEYTGFSPNTRRFRRIHGAPNTRSVFSSVSAANISWFCSFLLGCTESFAYCWWMQYFIIRDNSDHFRRATQQVIMKWSLNCVNPGGCAEPRHISPIEVAALAIRYVNYDAI